MDQEIKLISLCQYTKHKSENDFGEYVDFEVDEPMAEEFVI